MGCTRRASTGNRDPPTRSRSCGKASIQVRGGRIKSYMGRKISAAAKLDGRRVWYASAFLTPGCAGDDFTSAAITQLTNSWFFWEQSMKKSHSNWGKMLPYLHPSNRWEEKSWSHLKLLTLENVFLSNFTMWSWNQVLDLLPLKARKHFLF